MKTNSESKQYVEWYVLPLLIFITFFAFFIRIQYHNNTIVSEPIKSDARQYSAYGYNIFHYGIYSKDLNTDAPTPDSFRPPGYPLLIALSYLIGGEKKYYPAVMYFQTLLSTFLVLLTFYTAKRFLPIWAALAGSLLVALSPHLISLSAYLLTETLFGFFLLASLLSFESALKKQSILLFIFTAILFGYTYLINETILFLPYLLIIVAMFNYQRQSISKKSFTINTILFLICFTLFPLGWSIRNKVSLPPDTLRGSNRALTTLTHGTYPGFLYKSKAFKYFPYREDPMQPEFGKSLANFIRIFSDRFKQRPFRYLAWYLVEKPYYLWSWNFLQGYDVYIYPVETSLYQTSYFFNSTKKVMKMLHIPILVLAVLSIPLSVFLLKRNHYLILNRPIIPIILTTMIYYTILYSIFACWPRYSVPLRPELYMLALLTITAVNIKVRLLYTSVITHSRKITATFSFFYPLKRDKSDKKRLGQ